MNGTYAEETGLSVEVASVDMTFLDYDESVRVWVRDASDMRELNRVTCTNREAFEVRCTNTSPSPYVNPVLHTSASCNHSKVPSLSLSHPRPTQTASSPPYRGHSAYRTAQTTQGAAPS